MHGPVRGVQSDDVAFDFGYATYYIAALFFASANAWRNGSAPGTIACSAGCSPPTRRSCFRTLALYAFILATRRGLGSILCGFALIMALIMVAAYCPSSTRRGANARLGANPTRLFSRVFGYTPPIYAPHPLVSRDRPACRANLRVRAGARVFRGSITSRSAVAGARAVLNAHVSEPVETCDLFVDGKKARAMTVRDTLATTWYQFANCPAPPEKPTSSMPNASRRMEEKARNRVSIAVMAESANAHPGDLIKMACPARPGVNIRAPRFTITGWTAAATRSRRSACTKPVQGFFQSRDSFPGRAFGHFTRPQRHLQPASKLVKFSTVTVYAVTYGGMLRPISSEEIAKAVFGMDWRAQVEGVSDVFSPRTVSDVRLKARVIRRGEDPFLGRHDDDVL